MRKTLPKGGNETHLQVEFLRAENIPFKLTQPSNPSVRPANGDVAVIADETAWTI
jgi:hypothetical protein